MLITTRTAISDLLFCCCRCVRLMAGRLYRTLCFIRRFGTCLHSPLKGPRQLACQACVFTRCDDVARRIPQIRLCVYWMQSCETVHSVLAHHRLICRRNTVIINKKDKTNIANMPCNETSDLSRTSPALFIFIYGKKIEREEIKKSVCRDDSSYVELAKEPAVGDDIDPTWKPLHAFSSCEPFLALPSSRWPNLVLLDCVVRVCFFFFIIYDLFIYLFIWR